MIARKPLRPVYPSKEVSIRVVNDEEYGGAHEYVFTECLGFNPETKETEYSYKDEQTISFVRKNEDGSMIPGLQSEQLLIALIDRHKKLNNKFPSREGALAITKMEEALYWLQARVQERMDRGVMGELKQ